MTPAAAAQANATLPPGFAFDFEDANIITVRRCTLNRSNPR
jgi:hypothetical protein